MSAPLKGLRKPVRGVQIVEVEEKEKRSLGILIHPPGGGASNLLAHTLDFARVASSLGANAERTLVEIEALVQSEAPIQNKAADEGSRAVSSRFQDGGKSDST